MKTQYIPKYIKYTIAVNILHEWRCDIYNNQLYRIVLRFRALHTNIPRDADLLTKWCRSVLYTLRERANYRGLLDVPLNDINEFAKEYNIQIGDMTNVNNYFRENKESQS